MPTAFRLLLSTLAIWLGLTGPVLAHWADQAAAELVVDGREARMTLTFPTGLVATADADGDGRLSAAEIRTHAPALTKQLGEAIKVTSAGTPGQLSIEPVAEAAVAAGPSSHSTLALRYAWKEDARDVAMHYGLFLPGVESAHCLATVVFGDIVRNVVFTPVSRDMRLAESGPWQTAGQFVVLGVEHILIGYDHILFLIALLMMGGGLVYLLKIVTAFTVAHSLTLALAFFNVVSLPSRLVESAIALSIIYVAAEIFWRRDLKGRWLVTLLFGLIHGLGFASVLKELEVPASNVAVSLASFNVGVELGQIAIVAVAFAALSLVRRMPWDLAFRRWISAGVVAMGLVWFVERAFLA